jgi:hypothetical protein
VVPEPSASRRSDKMKFQIQKIACIIAAVIFCTCSNNPTQPDDENGNIYWPEICSSSPLWPGALGFRAMIVDTVYNEETIGEANYAYITTSSGDVEVQKLHWDHFVMKPEGQWPVLFSGSIIQNDQKFQFNGRDQNGGLQVRYETKYENKTFFFRFMWEIE